MMWFRTVKVFAAALAVGVLVLLASTGCLVTSPSPALDEILSDSTIDQRIQTYRTAEVQLTVTDAAGHPLADTPVTIQQVRHQFLFGAALFNFKLQDAALQAACRERFAALFNFATLPFYWGEFESKQNQPHTAQLKEMAEWCRDQHIQTKGHPLVWQHAFPAWAKDLGGAEIQRLELKRIDRDVKDFVGLIDTWDVVNEISAIQKGPQDNPISRWCYRVGAEKLVAQAFAHAQLANGKATLLLNDYAISEAHEKQVQSFLDAGIPIDIIGLQSHMHQGYWGKRQVWEICQRFAALGRPLHFTEATILSGELQTSEARPNPWPSTSEGERRQAQQVREFYRVLFSHPAVQAITWWDQSDRHAWRGAPAGLLHYDMTPKPSYDVLLDLVKKEWWTGPLTMRTDQAGKIVFRGYLGDYQIDAGALRGACSLSRPGAAQITAALRIR